jgi:hypothetical protein
MIVGGKSVPDPAEEDAGGDKGQTRGSGDTRRPGMGGDIPDDISGDTRGSGDTRKPGTGA